LKFSGNLSDRVVVLDNKQNTGASIMQLYVINSECGSYFLASDGSIAHMIDDVKPLVFISKEAAIRMIDGDINMNGWQPYRY
jgi:hypothetical protein